MPAAVLAATVELHRPSLTHTLDPVAVRHNDRIVLLGDADHPVRAGQGVSMALEDALVLARSPGTQTSVPAALSAYDAARSERVARMAKAAGNRDSRTAGPLGR
ncbi:hypothetical protein [Streptomyces sp. 2131.1]|uniref:hypothetical protein n=1 Tax=Streptomyces sp. 2131.1 TaxID=1855346 RepID=UPI00210ECDC2|nr:hypothetical protein [Streptomyces sp. 2131.1]